jgi:hypothetical protein
VSTLKRYLCAIVFAGLVPSFCLADSLLVSYSSGAGGGIEKFSLVPHSAGTTLVTESSGVTTVTVANNTAYWVSNNQIWSDNVADIGGAGKTALPSVPPVPVTITSLAVSATDNSYLVGWDAPGFGWFVAKFPLTGSDPYTVFSNDSSQVKGLTVSGNQAYWIDGTDVLTTNLDGSGRAKFQSFTLGPVTLYDVAVNAATQTYFLAASTPGLPPLIVQYPLTPQASGNLFTFSPSNNTITALTIGGDTVYWTDGSSIWSENLDGTGLTVQQTFDAGVTITDLAVVQDQPTATPVPEPSSAALMLAGLLGVGVLIGLRR